MKPHIIKKTSCRVCKGKNLKKVLILGPTPLANAFLDKKLVEEGEVFYPLDVYFCADCNFLQLGHVVDPEILFKDYVYVSSTSKSFVKHFEEFADNILKKFFLTKKDLVIDIGSNDGILLKPYLKKDIRVLGIEPAENIARIARKEGVETISDWFSAKLAKKIVEKKGKAKIITATNVFAHIDDLDDVLAAVNTLLTEDGVFITESPYLIDFLDKRYFDLVYHEHLSYWSIKPLMTLFKRFGLKIIDVERVSSHGGSIRVFAAKQKSNYKIEKNVAKFLTLEKKEKLNKISTYLDFNKEIQENKIKLLTILGGLKRKGKRIAGFGAPAKGNTLLNFFSIGTETLDYIVDDNKLKQGLFTPGKRIPVVPSNELSKNKPDYVFLLAWNFAESIMGNLTWYKKQGGRFIVPVPVPKII